MSSRNVEIIRGGFEALSEGGVEALVPLIHPEFEMTTPANLAAEPDTYRGPEGSAATSTPSTTQWTRSASSRGSSERWEGA